MRLSAYADSDSHLWVYPWGRDGCCSMRPGTLPTLGSICVRRLVNETDIVEMTLKSKRFNLEVRKQEALKVPEPVYQVRRHRAFRCSRALSCFLLLLLHLLPGTAILPLVSLSSRDLLVLPQVMSAPPQGYAQPSYAPQPAAAAPAASAPAPAGELAGWTRGRDAAHYGLCMPACAGACMGPVHGLCMRSAVDPPIHCIPAAAPAAAPVAAAAAAPKGGSTDGIEIGSPMSGTFYASAAPGDAAFVKVGDKVKKGQTVGIIEAMKLMNEIEVRRVGEKVEE